MHIHEVSVFNKAVQFSNMLHFSCSMHKDGVSNPLCEVVQRGPDSV